MALVLVAETQQVAVELLDMVLGDRDFRPGREDGLHELRIAGNFLLVTGAEGLDLQVREQLFDLPVGQPATLDARRRPDALDGRDAAQGRQAFRRQCAQGSPGPLELVDLGDECKHLRGDLQGGCLNHHPYLHPQIPISQAAISNSTPICTQSGGMGSPLPVAHVSLGKQALIFDP